MKQQTLRILSLLGCLILLFTAVGCAAGGKSPDDQLIDRALNAAESMREAVCNEDYRNLLYGSISSGEDFDVLREESSAKLRAVYEITIDPDRMIQGMAEEEMLAVYASLPESLKSKVTQQIYSYPISFSLSKSEGAMAMAISASFAESGAFLDSSLENRRFLFLLFETGFPVFASFFPAGDGIVTYSVQFLPIKDTETITSAETLISTMFDQIQGISAVLLKEYR